MDNNPIKIGIIGTGEIAIRFVEEAKHVSKVSVNAVYNPHNDSAKRFQKACGIKAIFDIDAFFDSIDAVYIATPHENHYEYAKSALKKGKHVLCEKPMAFSKEDAEELFDISIEKGVVLMEALKTLYCPGFNEVLETVRSGTIGKVRDVEAGFTKLLEPGSRPFTSKLGGAFTEYGSYPLLAIFSILGDSYKNVSFRYFSDNLDVDIYSKADFDYENAIATAKAGMGVKSEGELIISGENGYIYVPAPWWLTSGFEVRGEDTSKNVRFECEFAGDGLRYEIGVFADSIENAKAGINANISIALAGMMGEFLKRKQVKDGKKRLLYRK